MVDRAGIEPAHPRCKLGVLPLSLTAHGASASFRAKFFCSSGRRVDHNHYRRIKSPGARPDDSVNADKGRSSATVVGLTRNVLLEPTSLVMLATVGGAISGAADFLAPILAVLATAFRLLLSFGHVSLP